MTVSPGVFPAGRFVTKSRLAAVRVTDECWGVGRGGGMGWWGGV